MCLYHTQNTKFSSSVPTEIVLSPISRRAAAIESSIPSRYCTRDSFSGAGSLLRYIVYRSASSSGTSHDTGLEGTALSQANKSLREETCNSIKKLSNLAIHTFKSTRLLYYMRPPLKYIYDDRNALPKKKIY
jgi:hypothetical protein